MSTAPTSPTDSAIRAQGLAKSFRLGFFARKVTALRDATFHVPFGATVGLVGPNGAGKTTTIKILLGLIRASAGTASIDGSPVPELASRRRLGYLPEHPNFYDHLRPLEFLVFAGQLCGMSAKSCHRKAEELLEFVGLSGTEKKPIRKFSKGMVQRLGIAQTLIHDPQIVVLDEPQSGLDPIGRKEVKDMILDLKRRGRTVFFSSHILHDVEDVCDEIVVMINGRVRATGELGELLSRQIIETEVEVEGLAPEALDGLASRAAKSHTTDRSTILTFDGDIDQLAMMQTVARGGGKLVRLSPYREQLEDLFVREALSEGKPLR